jgi:AmmeMemoRadiSam system protein B
MVVGQLQEDDYKVIANSLSKVVRKGDVIVVSSDFTHQGPRFGFVPYKTDVKENVKKLDMGAVDYILQKDCGKFVGYVKDTGATICGRCPIGILLELLPKDAKGKLLSYYTSGDLTGDDRNTVSYVSLVFSSRSGWPKNQ